MWCTAVLPSTTLGGPGVRAEVPREPGVRLHAPCPGMAGLAGGAVSWPVLGPGQAVHALPDGDT